MAVDRSTAELHRSVRDLYAEQRRVLYAYALSLTNDPDAAEDVVQAAFFRVLRRSCPTRELRPFLFRCIRNLAIDRFRRSRSEVELFLPPEDRAESGDPLIARALRQCLSRLSRNQLETVLLKVYGGLSFREISEVRGVPEGTVASWYRRALARLRSMLEEEP